MEEEETDGYMRYNSIRKETIRPRY